MLVTGKPDIANTVQQIQGSGTDVAAIPGDQRDDRLTAKPCIILEKPRVSYTLKSPCMRQLEIFAPFSMHQLV